MKLITLYLFACISMSQAKISNQQISPVDNPMLMVQQHPESIPKATAIFWIDKRKRKEGEALKVRTVKAKVNISKEGKVKVISYVKVQHPSVERYIQECLKKFKVTSNMLNSYIKPGEQYVQLRYIPENVK